MTTPTPRWTADEQSIIDRIAIPVGGETRQEIEVQTAGLRYPCSDMPTAWRQFGELKAKNYDARIVQRDVWVGPWREVTDGD